MIIVIPILIFALEKRQKKISNAKRTDQLLNDFPEFISKFTLLNLAGLSISNSLQRIANDYTKNLIKTGKHRYVYDELVCTCQKIRNGTYEAYAYEELGRKYGLPCYIKFSSLLISGLKLGTSDFNRQLSDEVTTSLLERKADILQKSNKASTKLLGPMMMIFAVILILIMVPAFFTIGL